MASFDKNAFSEELKKILENYESITDMAKAIGMDRSHLSKFINKKFENPPSELTLSKIVNASKGTVSFNELLRICGFNEMIDEIELLTNGDLKYLNLLFEGENLTNEQKIMQIDRLIKAFDEYILSCQQLIDQLESSSLFRIIRKDTINIEKEEVRRSKEKLEGLIKIKKQLEEK